MSYLDRQRACGVLMHVTSLPSAYGVGDMGARARDFIGFLARAGQSWWQVLPLNPTAPILGDSPYSSWSMFAGNALIISPEGLAASGDLALSDLVGLDLPPAGPVDFASAWRIKDGLLDKAFARVGPGLENDPGFNDFLARHDAAWLDDCALFAALKKANKGRSWHRWPRPQRERDPGTMAEVRATRAVTREKYIQYVFFSQWARLKAYAGSMGVSIMGDLPFYPTHDSADVWSRPDLFLLGPDLAPSVVAGVPPDYFSATGQRWGNPLYDWQAMAREGYDWWLRRIRHNLLLADCVRLDHFRAFAAYYEIRAAERTALSGHWVEGPGAEFFEVLAQAVPDLPLLAEDLGLITGDVVKLREDFGLPGMRVLMFSFGRDWDTSPNSMHNHCRNSAVYTGTHDNNTARGWFEAETSQEDRDRMAEYLGHHTGPDTVARDLVRLAMLSPSALAMAPMQDVLGLPGDARMNVPSKSRGNWAWRVNENALGEDIARDLHGLARMGGRLPVPPGNSV